MKNSDVILLVFGYTAFWTLLVWFLIGIGAASLWYYLNGHLGSKKNKDRNS